MPHALKLPKLLAPAAEPDGVSDAGANPFYGKFQPNAPGQTLTAERQGVDARLAALEQAAVPPSVRDAVDARVAALEQAGTVARSVVTRP